MIDPKQDEDVQRIAAEIHTPERIAELVAANKELTQQVGTLQRRLAGVEKRLVEYEDDAKTCAAPPT